LRAGSEATLLSPGGGTVLDAAVEALCEPPRGVVPHKVRHGTEQRGDEQEAEIVDEPEDPE
jgi:hypothetical protein